VFQYRVKEGQVPALKIVGENSRAGHNLEWPSEAGLPGYYVLHVFAEADVAPGAAHIKEASQKSAALIGVNLSIEVRPLGSFLDVTPPPGLLREEVNLLLVDRVSHLDAIGALMQQGKDLVWPFPLSTEVETAGPGACGNIVGLPPKPHKP
jgi:hypothetical protein